MMMKMVGVIAMVAMVIVSGYGKVEAAVNCLEVEASLSECLSYVAGPDRQPNEQCCLAATELSEQAAASPGDRRALCVCLKNAAKPFPIDAKKSKKLPQLCNIENPIPLDPKVDCKSIPLVF